MKRPFFARYGLLILMVTAFLMPLMLMGAKVSLRSNKNDVKSWLPAHCEETATFQWYRERFESDMFILASWEGCTLDSPALDLLARKLVPPVDPLQNPATAPIRLFNSAFTGRQLLDDLIEKQGLLQEEAIERLKGFVIGQDGKQTCLVLSVCQESEARWDRERQQAKDRKARNQKFLHAVVERVYSVAEQECGIPPDKLHLGGPPVDNVAIDQEGERSLFKLAGVSAVVGIVMSWWCLRNWSLTAMVFTSALFTAGLSLLVVTLAGETMNAILLTMPSLVYVAAVSGAIHLANYYRDTVRHSGFDGAPDRAVKNAWLPLALATGTTAIGLASMCITNLVPIRMFGLYSAIGVMISFVVVIFYVPSLLHFFPLRRIVEPVKGGLIDPGLSPRWRSVGEFIIRRSGLVTAVCLTVMAVGACGVAQTQSSVKLMRLFSPRARIIHDYAWLEEHLGALVPMEIVIRVDSTKCDLNLLEQVKLVAEVQQNVRTLEDVGSALAVPTFVPVLPERPSVFERSGWAGRLERHRKDLREYWYKDGDEELWRVSARVAALTDLDYGEFVANIQDAVEPVMEKYRAEGHEGLTAVYTGLVPLVYQAQSSMLDGLTLNFVGDLILIGIAIIFLLRNLSAGLLLALPCLFPLAVVFGAMGWFGIVVDVGTVMVPAVALGVTVDDAIHFMLWCRHGEERGMSKRDSIMFAYGDCARAIYQSWAVIGLGLSAFALSSFTPTQRFGYLMFTMLTVSSIGNLVLLPALLASPLGRFFWLGEKARRHKHAPELHIARPEEPAEERLEEPVEAVIPMISAIPPATGTASHIRRDAPHRRRVGK